MRDSVVLDSNVANLDDDGVVSTDDENTSVDDRETKDNDLKRTFPTKPKERLLRTKNECRANVSIVTIFSMLFVCNICLFLQFFVLVTCYFYCARLFNFKKKIDKH